MWPLHHNNSVPNSFSSALGPGQDLPVGSWVLVPLRDRNCSR